MDLVELEPSIHGLKVCCFTDYISGVAIEHTIVQVRTMARALFDAAVDRDNFLSGNSELAQAIMDTSSAILTKIEYIEFDSNRDQIDNVAHDLRLVCRVLASRTENMKFLPVGFKV